MKIAENSNSNKIIKNSADEISKNNNPSVLFKNNIGGITLIALVITIIVLLILAGASLSAVLGENGIITRAETAAETSRINAAKEQIELAVIATHMDRMKDKQPFDLEYIKDNIGKELSGLEIIGTHGSPIDRVYVKYDDEQFMIDEEGNVIHIGDVDFNTIPDLAIVPDQVVTGVDKVVLTLSTEVELGQITKIVTPTGEITGGSGTYEITENGTYEFTVYTDQETEIKKTVVIDNIQKPGIDVTNLIAGGDDHQHIYESKYDSTNHWEQCSICDNVVNQKSHTITISGNAATCDFYTVLGQEICSDGCGYSKQVERLEHIRPQNTTWETITTHYHISYQCERCGGAGENYLIGQHRFNLNNEILTSDQIKSKGINVHTLGSLVCIDCNYNIDLSFHVNIAGPDCLLCTEVNYPTVTVDVAGNKIENGIVKIDLINNESQYIYFQADARDFPNYTNAVMYIISDSNYILDSTNLELVSQEDNIFLFRATIRLKDNTIPITGGPIQLRAHYFAETTTAVGGYGFAPDTTSWTIDGGMNFWIYADSTAPVITNVTATNIKESNGWATSKQITVTGTEKMNEVVYVSMYYPDKTPVFEKSATTITNGAYTFTTTPILEANEATTFTIKVEDMFGNATTKELVLEKIDSKTPTLMTEIVDDGKWSKRRSWKLEAIDTGIGQVSFAFNEQNDYKLGAFADNKYSITYNLLGDVNESKPMMLYMKDGLGNLATAKLTIGKIDGTSPTINNVSQAKNGSTTQIIVQANDYSSTLTAEGSGINGYAITRSKEMPSAALYQTSNTFNIDTAGTYYVWVKDTAGNLVRYNEEIVVE